MFKSFIIQFVFIFCSLSVFSQEKQAVVFNIKGTVVDSVSRDAIPYCTVSVSKKNAPTVHLKRFTTDANGKFSYENRSGADTLLITFESVGMELYTKTIFPGKEEVDLGKIALKQNNKILSEVTVVATKPLVKVDIDKISYDTKSDPEAQTLNVLDMLRKVPMVTVDAEDNIKIKGNSNFRIFMNGKPSNITTNNPSQVLKSIPASTIKNIEVITQPGSKYEAEGVAGIINIITDKAMAGYTATLRAGLDIYGAANGGVYFSTKIGKFGVTANLNSGQSKSPDSRSSLYRENYASEQYKYTYQNSKGKNTNNYRYGDMSFSYEIDSLNLLTLSASGWGGGGTSKYDGYTSTLTQQLDTIQKYASGSNSESSWGGYDGSLDYQRSFKKPDKLITLSYKLSYSPSKDDYTTAIDGLINYTDRKQHIKSNAYNTEHALQFDYTEPFHKIHVIEAGAKYIIRYNVSNNNYLNYNFTDDSWQTIADGNDKDMWYRQNILGMYGSYKLKLSKFSAKAGLRFERTTSKVDYKNHPEYNSDIKPFSNLIPSVDFGYNLSDAASFQLGYTQRVSRPGIWFLNPFRDTSNPLNIQQGNPNLKSEINHSFSLAYNYFNSKVNFNSSLYHSFTNNSIESVSSMLNDTVMYTTYQNIGVSKNTGLSLYVRWQINPKISIYVNSDGGYSYLKYENAKNSGTQFSVYAGGSYNLPKDLRLSLNSGYSSPSVTLQGKSSGYNYYSMSLNKGFFNKKLNIWVSASNFLQKNRTFKNNTRTDTYFSESIYNRKALGLRVGVSYAFGEMKATIKTVSRTINNDDVKGGGNKSGGGGS